MLSAAEGRHLGLPNSSNASRQSWPPRQFTDGGQVAHVRCVTAGCFLRVPIRASPRRGCPTQAGPRVNQEARRRSGGTQFLLSTDVARDRVRRTRALMIELATALNPLPGWGFGPHIGGDYRAGRQSPISRAGGLAPPPPCSSIASAQFKVAWPSRS